MDNKIKYTQLCRLPKMGDQKFIMSSSFVSFGVRDIFRHPSDDWSLGRLLTFHNYESSTTMLYY
jgi:hypothetical protein